MRLGPPLFGISMALLAGCSFSASTGKAVDKADVEHQVATQLAAKVGQQPKSVECPGDLQAKKGATMRCQLQTPDQTKYGVTVTVTSVNGSKTDFHIQVDNKPAAG